MKYALELSGLMPEILSDTQTGNRDEKDEQRENCLSIKNEGEAFWAWFKSGLLGGKLAINTPDAKVHCVMEYLFCQSPAVFYQYIQEAGKIRMISAILFLLLNPLNCTGLFVMIPDKQGISGLEFMVKN